MKKLLLVLVLYFLSCNCHAPAQNNYSLDYSAGNDYTTYPTADYRASDSYGYISCWVRLNGSLGTTQGIWCSASETVTTKFILLRLDTGNQLEILQRNADVQDQVSFTTTTFTTGVWYHIVFSTQGTGTSWACWVNGVSQSATVDAGANNGDWMAETADRENFVLGIFKRTTVAQPLDGWIDEVIYVNEEVDQAAVNALYNDGKPKDESDPQPISYWRFEEGTGQSVNDEGSENADLQLGSGAGVDAFDPSWSTTTPGWASASNAFKQYSSFSKFKGF